MYVFVLCKTDPHVPCNLFDVSTTTTTGDGGVDGKAVAEDVEACGGGGPA
jgi:hypothetical protein